MNQNAYYALNHGQTGSSYKWSEGNVYGDFTPIKDFYVKENNLYCREYYQTVNIAGKAERAYGKACRMPDGAWKIMN
jgi:surface antigen